MPTSRLVRTALRAVARAGGAAQPVLGGPVEIEGNRLDPELRAILGGARRLVRARIETMTPPAARAYSARMLAAFDATPAPMARIVDTAAPGPAGDVPIRLYQPIGARPELLVLLHGGGGVIGSVASYDPVARLVAHRAGCVVASVDYRLAPEHPHPAAIDDAVAAWAWACARAPALGVDPRRIGVVGDSFGGYLAAWVERRAAAAGLPRPAVTGLVYPLTDLTMSSPSLETFADGFLLTRSMMTWFRGHYCPDQGARRAASPLWLDDLSGAGAFVVVTAGFDPLRDEGARYARRLEDAGARVTYRCEGELVHGFAGLTGAFRRADAAVTRLCDDLARELRA